ncbi:MAG TPA: pyridoxamine 5'-phosphate oxidase family protein [Chthoniobacterales bacterium]|nr:pyridoxamine 5'-phosphate oxidase family protein [Chthoniobacterales bacterium]
MGNKYLEIAATDSVKRVQQRLGSRTAYARREGGPAIHQQLGPEEISFIEAQDTFFLASVSETGWPYVQHRGGPKRFLKVLDQSTIGFPEFSGNRQYLSFGNILQDPRVSLFLLDFRRQERLKIFGRATLAERAENPDLFRRLETENLPSKVERGIIIQVEAFDWNCSQYIVPRFSEDEVRDLLQPLKQRINELETRIRNQESRTGNPSLSR